MKQSFSFIENETFDSWNLKSWAGRVQASTGSRIFQTGRGATPEEGTKTYYFGKIFAQNCMKMKETGSVGGHVPSAPLDLPVQRVLCFVIYK